MFAKQMYKCAITLRPDPASKKTRIASLLLNRHTTVYFWLSYNRQTRWGLRPQTPSPRLRSLLRPFEDQLQLRSLGLWLLFVFERDFTGLFGREVSGVLLLERTTGVIDLAVG